MTWILLTDMFITLWTQLFVWMFSCFVLFRFFVFVLFCSVFGFVFVFSFSNQLIPVWFFNTRYANFGISQVCKTISKSAWLKLIKTCFPFYCPVLRSGGWRKTCVQKWTIHQTPSLHSLQNTYLHMGIKARFIILW